MRESAALARRRGVRLHTHLAETLDEEAFCLERFGVRPVEYLDDLGWLGPDVWLAHCVHLSTGEVAPLRRDRHRRGALPVAPTPGSAPASRPSPDLLDAGVAGRPRRRRRRLERVRRAGAPRCAQALLVARLRGGPAGA